MGTAEDIFAVLTLGLACTTGICSGRVTEASTAPDGSYRFDLTGRDTQPAFGRAVSHLPSVNAPPGPRQVSGAAASARFRVQTQGVRLPLLELGDPPWWSRESSTSSPAGRRPGPGRTR